MNEERSKGHYLLGLVVSAIFGVIVAFRLFPAPMLMGSHVFWDDVIGDNSASLIGIYAFYQDEWRWPLLRTDLVDPPHGINAYYTDAVPVLLLLGKLIYKMTGHIFVYVGPWILACYILNAVIGYAILRSVSLSALPAVIGSSFFVIMPAFLWRFVHFALLGHFFILTAIYLYFKFTSESSERFMVGTMWAYGLMVFVSPYLMVLSAAVLLAGLLDGHRYGRITFRHVALALVGYAAVVGFGAYACGIIGTAESVPKSLGFGYYSMNLLSPIWPQWSVLSFGRGALDATGGQYEGVNYLGAGLLAIMLTVLVWSLPSAVEQLKARPWLVCMCAILALYAVSNRIYAGYSEVITIGYQKLAFIGDFTSIFRSSGRFFWPVSYLIATGLICLVNQRFGPERLVAPFLAFASVLQIIDMVPMYEVVRHYALDRKAIAQRPAIRELVKQHDEVLFHPKVLCAAQEDRNTLLQFQLMAALEGKPIYGAYVNRGDLGCAASTLAFEKNHFYASQRNYPLLIMMRSSVSPQMLRSDMSAGVQCRETESAFICSKGSANSLLYAIGAPITEPTFPLGQNLAINGDGSKYLGKGWSAAENEFRWAIGTETQILVRFTDQVCGSLTFTADIQPFSFKSYKADQGSISANGGAARPLRLPTLDRQALKVQLPLPNCADHADIRITFSEPKAPADVGMNPDTRQVTWGFRSFGLSAE